MSSVRSNTPDPDDLSDSTLGTAVVHSIYKLQSLSVFVIVCRVK